ncbi:MAG TPA: arylamine N-acetyltransferase [Vicinamibacterales bacterium]|nr:arylamine N-acetyltransferase [Vicinamibacterales bacterium]
MRVTDYLARIGIAPPVGATLDTLRRIHLAHRETFLFENLTIQNGGAISVDVADLERKFLDEGRGGYCFEHNTLFKAALTDLGFAPITLLGRVRRGPPERWCRTHMVLRVPGVPRVPNVPGVPNVPDVPGVPGVPGVLDVLADVGFGGLGLLEPIEMRDGATAAQGGITYTLRRDDPLWVLSMRDADGNAMDLYEFTDDPQTPWDIVVANHFTSTHPESVFRKTLTIQKASRDERVILRGDVLTRYVDGHMMETSLDPAGVSAAVSTRLESRRRTAAAGR